MIWTKESPYTQTSGSYTISKYHLGGGVIKYVCWKLGERLAQKDSFEAAKDYCEELERVV